MHGAGNICSAWFLDIRIYKLVVIVCVYVCLFLGTTLYRHFSLLWSPSLEKLIIIIMIIIIIVSQTM